MVLWLTGRWRLITKKVLEQSHYLYGKKVKCETFVPKDLGKKGGKMQQSMSAPVLPGARSAAMDELSMAINERFDASRMFQAFKSVDLDNSGRWPFSCLKKDDCMNMCMNRFLR